MNHEPVILITEVSAPDADGYPVTSRHSFPFFAEVCSVKRTEFWEGYKAGVRPTVTLILYEQERREACIRTGDAIFEPSEVLIGDVRYKIVRAYQPNQDKVELTCEKVM